jgi:hypothetical protein
MVLKGVDDDGDEPSNNPTPSGLGRQVDHDERREEQRKAKNWLKIGWALVISAAFIVLVSISVFVTSVTLMVVSITVIAVCILIWNVAFGILAIPSLEAWIIESKGIFLRVAVKSPIVLPLRGFITHVAQKISMKEIVGRDVFGDRKLRLESTLIGVEADITYIVKDFYRFYYSVKAEKDKTWKQTMNDLIRATTRDALQTYASTEGPDEGPHTIDTIVQIKGADLSGRIFASDDAKYREIRDNFKRWGIGIVTLIFGDFQESDEDMKLKKDVLDAEQKRKIAKIEIATKEMEGEAAAKGIAAASWKMAKNYAGITKLDKDLTPEERRIIASYVQEAEASYRKTLSIAAIKPTDKTIITSGKMIETIGDDAAREAIRREMSKELKEGKQQGEEKKKMTKEEKKEEKKED